MGVCIHMYGIYIYMCVYSVRTRVHAQLCVLPEKSRRPRAGLLCLAPCPSSPARGTCTSTLCFSSACSSLLPRH